MLRKLRIALASISLLLITLLFLDFTGTVHAYLGWIAQLQLVPAVLAGSVFVLIFLAVLTVFFGRLYCSIICPLGIVQDLFAWLGKKAKKNRYAFSPSKTKLRLGILLVFILSLFAYPPVVRFIGSLLEPYSAFGRIATNLLAPVYQWGNNVLAYFAERSESYAFYETEVWMRSAWSVGIAAATLVVVSVLAWRGGRTYCNTICPVGSLLGLISHFSKGVMLRPVIDTSKCNGCRLCEKNCKGACINSKEHEIDYSRCVMCMDCISTCKRGAIKYAKRAPQALDKAGEKSADAPASSSRRAFLTGAVIATATTAVQAQKKKVDGGLAVIEDKVAPQRETPILPPGALNVRHFTKACTACQLCVSACPNQVLRPSNDLERLMQPEVSYERGYCRPECTSCSNVCPTGALTALTREEKSSRQIGRAVWIKKNCLPMTEGVSCGNCARHCPTGAIQMIPSVEGDDKSVKIPAINTERCIGCGACENLCPSRPFSAIVVEGLDTQKIM